MEATDNVIEASANALISNHTTTKEIKKENIGKNYRKIKLKFLFQYLHFCYDFFCLSFAVMKLKRVPPVGKEELVILDKSVKLPGDALGTGR